MSLDTDNKENPKNISEQLQEEEFNKIINKYSGFALKGVLILGGSFIAIVLIKAMWEFIF